MIPRRNRERCVKSIPPYSLPSLSLPPSPTPTWQRSLCHASAQDNEGSDQDKQVWVGKVMALLENSLFNITNTQIPKLELPESVFSDFPQYITQELSVKFGTTDNRQSFVLNASSPGNF